MQVGFPTLQGYQNPCWYQVLDENVTSMYENNHFKVFHKKPESFLRKLAPLVTEKLINDYKQNIPQFRCLPFVYLMGKI